jgi:tetratricopeptide (TPR) repeat protein
MISTFDSERVHHDRRRLVSCLLVVSLLAAGAGLWQAMRRPSTDDLALQARQALAAGRAEDAQLLTSRALKTAPDSPAALVAAGEVAIHLQRHDEALRYYSRAAEGSDVHALVGAGAAGDLALKRKQLSEAEHWFRRVLELDPQHTVGHRRLAAILVLSGRRRESTRHLEVLLRQGTIEPDELILLGDVELVFDDPELLESFLRAAPEDPLPLVGRARIAIRRSELAKAAELLHEAIDRAPDLRAAHVSLGRILAETGPEQEFYRWHARLLGDAEGDPDLWAVRGRWARKTGEQEVAIRCYWEAVRRDPNHWRGNHHLAQLLMSRGERESAEPFSFRADRLNELARHLLQTQLKGISFERALAAAELTEELGRLWEAWGWYRAATLLRSDRHDVRAQRDRLKTLLTDHTPLTLLESNPTQEVDLSRYPLPQWDSGRVSDFPMAAGASRQGHIRFVDRAASCGIDFSYYSGDDPQTAGFRTWQSFGGGVAVLDYDLDWWPDLHFTQGGAAPLQADPRHWDQLFRNLDGERFENVTAAVRIRNDQYGQGVTVGDYDGDGFADLYLANFGENRLYRNNGDGTFSDETQACGISGARWTTSCLLIDLNQDGLPDVYEVNYLDFRSGNILNHYCIEEKINEYRTCPPTNFSAEQDRIYLNLGDGRFADVTETTGIIAPEGKGLGIVAADFDGDRRLDLFVANDTTANFLFINGTSAPGAVPFFEERAVLSGCAFDVEGRSQACMGIAADDADGDGLIDLFATNFYNEYNVLYKQESGALFIDHSSEAGLAEPSVRMLGFGTQFIDGDLDGWPDLVVANGHVDDYLHKDIPFHMQPQYFRNAGGGRFQLLPSTSIDDYFGKARLGRGLARLDWNRDGREDFTVSHLDSPAALVTNETPRTGRHLTVQLRGVQSSRDAIGTRVQLTAGERTWTKQLTAGDGYYASNQRQLVFGLGDIEQADELAIRWPSGLEQTWSDIAAGSNLLLVEGQPEAMRLAEP